MAETTDRVLSDDELRNLLDDIHKNKVFGSWQLHKDTSVHDLMMVFAAMHAMNGLMIDYMKKIDVVHVYEYLSASTGIYFNGKPTFLSFRYLTRGDYKRLCELHDETCPNCNRPLSDSSDRLDGRSPRWWSERSSTKVCRKHSR